MSGPIRGLHDVEGQLYAVSGSTLYRMTPSGVAIPLGLIPGVGRVSMAHNQVAGGHQLTIVNGVGGYVWNTATQTFDIITDEGFPGSSRVDFIDGYMMHVEPFGRFLLHSDLADALNFNTLDRFEAETAPDRTTTLIVNGTEVWAFGERTIDVFYNAGTAQGTFQNKKVGITNGCIAGASPAICDGGVAWLGDDRVVYHARGYSPTRISTRALDVVLSECSLSDIRNAFSFVYSDRGHTIYYLTIPNGMTFGYDFSTGLWHRRASWHPEKDIYGRWCLSDLVRSNGKWIGGDYRTGKLYELDWDYPLEGCEPLIRERTSPVLHNNGNRVEVHEVQPLFDTGRPTVECVPFEYQPVGPQISGEAPDGLTSEPYSFTYTVTQGTAPISRTVLRDTELPAGWSWNEQTATISHDDTPIPVTAIRLKMRVYDTNGLFADHEDDLVVAQQHILIVSGSSLSSGSPTIATAQALGDIEFQGIAQDTGADLQAATVGHYDGVWMLAARGGIRYSESPTAEWEPGSIPFQGAGDSIALCGGPAGWLVSNADESFGVTRANGQPYDFAAYSYDIERGDESLGVYSDASLLFCRYVGGYYYATAIEYPGTGLLRRSLDLSTVWEGRFKRGDDGPSNGDTISGFYDVAGDGESLYATVNFRPLSNHRNRLVRSTDGGMTFPTVLVDRGRLESARPWQVAAGGGAAISISQDCRWAWSSADDFSEPHATGISQNSSGGEFPAWEGGKMIIYVAPYFYIISGSSNTPGEGNMCVRTLDGISFSEPRPLGITGARAIASDYSDE